MKYLALTLAAVLVAGPTLLQAGPRTVELFQQAMRVPPVRSHGAKLYREYCMECHGKDAQGDGDNVIPALAGQVERYVVKQLVDFSELDRDAPEMHRLMARTELARPSAWRDLAAYLTQLPLNTQPQVGSGRDFDRGAHLYGAYCASCHGAFAEGLEQAPVPALRGQHYSYLVLQLKSFDADHRHNLDSPLLEHMVDLQHEDIELIADYLARLPKHAQQEKIKATPPSVPPNLRA